MCALLRNISSVSDSDSEDGTELLCELDSHADTVVAGSNCIAIGDPTRKVTVSAFSPGYGRQLFDVGTAATVWTDPSNGDEYVLVFHESILLLDGMRNTLVCTNQLRANGIKVHDCPTQFDKSSPHHIVIPSHKLTIPLQMRGVFSGFVTRKPDKEDLENLPHVEMTSTAH